MQPSGTNFVHVGGETEPLYDKAHIVILQQRKVQVITVRPREDILKLQLLLTIV